MFSFLFVVFLYFLPAIIGRDKSDATGIFLLNLFLGWTLIGWVAAFIGPSLPTGHIMCTMFLPAWDASVRRAAHWAPLARISAEPAAVPFRLPARSRRTLCGALACFQVVVTDATPAYFYFLFVHLCNPLQSGFQSCTYKL